MDLKEKIGIIEECMELDEGTLTVDSILDDYEEWDSLAKLSLIAMIDSNFGKKISSDAIQEITTVSDAIKLMD